MGFIIAILSGALMSVQGVWNTQVTKVSGLWVTTMWVQLLALGVSLILWLVTGREAVSSLMKVEPRYMLLGGALGAGITWTVVKSMGALGPAKAALMIVVAQLIVAYIIELMGLFQVEKQELEIRKVIGMLVALGGIWLFNGGKS